MMPSPAFKTMLHCVLSAVVLMGGLVPPTVQHAHAGGDQPHTHSPQGSGHAHHHGEPGHSHHGRIRDCDHHHRHQADGAVCEAAADGDAVHPGAVVHRHFSWLGFEFTFPAREGEESERQDPAGLPAVLAAVRLADESVGSAKSVRGGWTLLGDLTAALASRCGAPAAICAPGSCAGPLVAGFLCDIARHDRSGVLLI